MANCKVCGSEDLHKVIDLGTMPNSNGLVTRENLKTVKSYPLEFYWCAKCSFFQQLTLVPREDLFNSAYTYITSINTPTVDNFREFSARVSKDLSKKDFAVIVASNDGTEIQVLKEAAGFKKVIGVDPSSNVAKMANDKGLLTINDFFGYELSKRIVAEHGNADLVVAKGVFAHIPDPKDMLLGMKNLIGENGTIAIEVHWLKSTVEKVIIDSLYAEHYYEFDVKSMKTLANSLGLKIVDIEFLPELQGGELRYYLKKNGDESITKKYMEEEERAGLYNLESMNEMQRQANARKERLVTLIKDLKAQDKRISVWTSAAKVALLFDFCGITNREIDFSYEGAATKIGKIIPMADIEIKNESLIENDMPDYLIIGSWNYMEFAKKKFAGYLKKGGKFIDPLKCEII